MKALALLVLLTTCSLLQAKRLHPERHYQQYYANLVEGETEVVLEDRTRCDIVTATHAIEVDFADKWAEAIGQSLSYGLNLNLKPAIVLIMEQENDERHFIRINTIIDHYQLNIEVFPIRVFKGEGLKK
jgi:hypothetical protein